jgi:hypothetical protein
MTRGELLDFLTERANEFRKDKLQISRNVHLTEFILMSLEELLIYENNNLILNLMKKQLKQR